MTPHDHPGLPRHPGLSRVLGAQQPGYCLPQPNLQRYSPGISFRGRRRGLDTKKRLPKSPAVRRPNGAWCGRRRCPA